ncbi:Uncharacterised protein [Vibrio cholerae]|nr:Uncharacterised protein [Vibrio cholerae]
MNTIFRQPDRFKVFTQYLSPLFRQILAIVIGVRGIGIGGNQH